jgi:predicted ABC-type transport system involved in lysophospholipase L1 biosynthesis ATPase subunit
LFRRLNQDGTTLVVVTHDETLAAEAGRVIHMLDGRIVSEPARMAASSVTRLPASSR